MPWWGWVLTVFGVLACLAGLIMWGFINAMRDLARGDFEIGE